MAKETVLVGCRLPNGLILHHPKDPKMFVVLSGTSETSEGGLYLPPRAYRTTEVDAEFWNAWKAAYAGFPPLKTRAVFEAKTESEASEKAKELKKERTGFEQMPKTATIDGIKLEQSTI